MKKLIIVASITLLIVLFGLFIWTTRENKVLHKAIEQYQSELKQKTEQVNQLQSMLDSLMTQQVKIERTLKEKKVKKETIAKEVAILKANEVCNEFKKLGYNPTCN